MKLVSLEISDLKSDFEGGSSFSINWFDVLRRASDKVRNNINPETLKRIAPIYAGLTKDLQIYYCPADVKVPSRLYSPQSNTWFDYEPPGAFYRRQWWLNKFTIEYVNGVRFIVLRHSVAGSQVILDEMEEAGTKTGVALSINNFNVLPGAIASMQGTFDDEDYRIGDDVSASPLDISNHLYGAALVPIYVDSAEKIEYVKLRLITTMPVAATGTLTSNGTNVTDADTVTIGSTVYRFKNTLALAYDVKIGATAADTLENLKKAINASGTAGTHYFAGTLVHPTVSAGTLTATTLALSCRTRDTSGNSIATTDTATTLSFGGAVLSGGVTGAYYELSSTLDSVGDYLRDGQNVVRLDMKSRTTTGTPETTEINFWEIDVKMDEGESQTVIFGKVTIQAAFFFGLEYYSNKMFVDGTTRAWKDTPSAGDYINLDDDALGIFHYEAARLVAQMSATNRKKTGEGQHFDTELTREYSNYFRNHPSSAQPLSYNIAPVIPTTIDPYEGGYVDMPEELGSSIPADNQLPISFADAEVPAGTFDGVNQQFTLLHVPSPGASLLLVLNGQVLTLGQHFTLAANVITLLSPYYDASFANTPFTASYRYTV